MKTIIFSLLLSFISLFGFSQAYQVTVSGTVMFANTGVPVDEIPVTIETDSVNGTGYFNVVYTDSIGYYTDTYNAQDGETGILYTSINDCDGSLQMETNSYSFSTNTFQVDFSFCSDPGGGGDTSCMAMFSEYPGDNPLEIYFTDESIGNPNNWDWDFGDGETDTVQNPVHLYQQFGEYEVTLTITGDSCSSSYTDWIRVDDDSTGGGCQAMFWAQPEINDFMTYSFFDMSSTWSGSTPDSWSWDFGDSTYSSEQNPTHTYSQQGEYNVCLTITDPGSDCISTYCLDIDVIDFEGCMADFYYMPADSMGFDMTNLHFYDFSFGNPDSWAWDFGDGTTSTEQNPIHQYDQEGIYNVCLTIANSADSCQDTYCDQVNVYNDTTGDCYGYFEYQQIDSTGLTLEFQAVNFSNNTMNYTWDFGDGNSDTGEVVVHTYSDDGTYNVILTATGTDSSSCSWVNVLPVWVGNNWSFAFSGNVYLDSMANTMADAGNVYLMAFDTTGNGLINIDTSTIEDNGYYSFDISAFQRCVYYIQAELSDTSAYFGQYLPTYHINSLSWEEAIPIFPFCPAWSYDIFMVQQGTTNSGNATIDGVVTTESNRSTVEGVILLLMDENGNPINYIKSAADGSFDFSQIAYGTYKLRAEYVGIESQTTTIVLSEDNPVANIDVTLKDGYAYLGMEEISSAYLKELGNIYPNPVTSEATVKITMKQSSQVNITVTNQIGQIVINNNEHLNIGQNSVKINVLALPQGIYIIKVIGKDGALATKKMIKIN